MKQANLRFSKSDDLVTRRIAGETVIVMVRSQVADLDYVYTLDKVGTRVWELIEDHSVGQIVDAIRRDYDVGAEPVEQDVLEFVAALKEAGLIQVAEAEGPRSGNA